VIAKLSGVLDAAGEEGAVIDVGGVGYLVFCSAATLGRLPAPGEAASLLIETHVREDHIHLFGFLDTGERDWFRLLLTVQGVGAKVALAILSALRPGDLVRAIAAQDRAGITAADGVGPKLAARIINELRDKAGTIALVSTVGAAGAADGAGAVPEGAAEAVSALVNLGYRRMDAFGAVNHAAQRLGGDAPVTELIRAGLRELGA